MKRPKFYLLISICFVLYSTSSRAQRSAESSVPYFRYALSGGIGTASITGDLQKKRLGAGSFLRADYYFRHGLSIGIEGQEGILRSGGSNDVEVHPVTLVFFSGILGIRFEPLAFIQDDHDRRIMYRKSYLQKAANSAYIGGGIGGLFNYTRSVAVTTYNNGTFFDVIYHTDIGVDLPLSKMHPYIVDSFFWYLNINGQLNFAADSGMDGFPAKKDRYGIFSVGVKLKL